MNANEVIYGPIADQAATKYGLDTTLFRNLIRSESSFNPFAVNSQSVRGQYASGIAQFLPSTAESLGVDPFNPNSALDGAAKYLKSLTDQYGMATGIAKYKGYSDSNMTSGLRAAASIIGTDTLAAAVQKSKDISSGTNDVPLWKYTYSDLKDAIKNGALSFSVGFIGFVIIAFSIYAIFVKGQSINIGGKVLGIK